MKHVVIGDLHGSSAWQKVDIKLYDKVVFLGDYVDSDTLSDLNILENLQKIIALKKRDPDKIVLLLGNHDARYLHYPLLNCSGFRRSMQQELTSLFRKYAGLFQIAYQSDKTLFTHAGVTSKWYQQVVSAPWLKDLLEPAQDLAAKLNALERSKHRDILYDVGIERGGDGYGGPLWADVKETFTDMLPGYHQVVGHTRLDEIRTVSYADRSMTYTDVLSVREQFYEIDIK